MKTALKISLKIKFSQKLNAIRILLKQINSFLMQRYLYLNDVTTVHCAFNKTNNLSLQNLTLKIYNDISEVMKLYKNSFLTFKAPITTAADDIYKYFLLKTL